MDTHLKEKSSADSLGNKSSQPILSSKTSATKLGGSSTDIEKSTASPIIDDEEFKPTREFWLVMLAIALSVLCAALDLTAITVALPTIVDELQAEGNFVWATSSYTLVAAAFLPWSAGLANIFGRRPVMVFALVVFAVGSAVSGAAHSMNMLIIGRSVMGLGAGFILSLTDIIVSDMVPLKQRGAYLGFIGAVWALASGAGPIAGGALSSAGRGKWRWIFYLNIPICGIAILLCLLFMRLKTPPSTWREKLARMDFLGNFFAIGGTTSFIIGLTFGGTSYPWASANVLVPIIIGVLGFAVFIYIEIYHTIEATIPFDILFKHRNSQVAAIHIFLQGFALLTFIYFYPFYLQGAFGVSAIRSAVLLLVTSVLIAPGAIAVGASVSITGKFVLVNWIGWTLLTVGTGLLFILTEDSSLAMQEGLQVLPALGIGMLFTGPVFSLMSPLAPQENAPALSMLCYLRTLGELVGLTVASAVFNSRISDLLPEAFKAQLGGGGDLAYAGIFQINTITDPVLKLAVRKSYADSVHYVWIVLLPIVALGLIACIPLREVQLHGNLDERYAVKTRPVSTAVEKQATSPKSDRLIHCSCPSRQRSHLDHNMFRFFPPGT